MIWLEAVLAFALLMLVFSTMVSVIVETFLRIFMMREKGFKLMLEQIFDDAVKPYVEQRLSNTAIPTKGQFVEALTRNPALPARAGHDKGSAAGTNEPERLRSIVWAGIKKQLIWAAELFVPRKTGNITVMEFAERLAATDVGKDIARQGEAQVEAVVKHLTQKFENVGKAATEYYARRAGMLSMVVAIAFAGVANIDAVRLFRTLVNNQQITEGIIAQSDEIQQNHLEQQKAIKELLKEIEERQKPTKEDKTDATASDKLPSLGELRATAESLRGELTGLANQGLPIAWSVYPYCSSYPPDPKCAAYLKDLTTKVKANACAENGPKEKPFGGAHETLEECVGSKATMLDAVGSDLAEAGLWLISVLLAGLLIGLGGPFWYDMVTSLSRVVQLARAAGLARPAKPKEGEAETAESAKTTEQPKNPVEAFKVAAAYDNSGPKLLAHW